MAQVRKIDIQLPDDLAITYANMVRVAHTPGEFVLDFTSILPMDTTGKVSVRVVMAPLGLKLLHKALSENIARYETTFGEIKLPDTHSLAEDLFHQPPGPDEKA